MHLYNVHVQTSILAGWLHQNNSNEWAEGSLRLEVEEEARHLEFISDCEQNGFSAQATPDFAEESEQEAWFEISQCNLGSSSYIC